MEEMDEIIGDFLVESYENLDRLDRELVELEQDPSNRQRLAGIFRTIHTIKGSCGFLGFTTLESVTHVGENMLSKLRDGLLPLTPARTTALLQLIDAVRQLLSNIENLRNEGPEDYAALKVRLAALTQADDAVVGAAESAPKAASPAANLQSSGKSSGQGEANAASKAAPALGHGPGSAVAASWDAPEAWGATAHRQSAAVAKVNEVLANTAETNKAINASGPAGDVSSPLQQDPLGELLVSKGRITRKELDRVISQAKKNDARSLSELLLEQGTISADEIVELQLAAEMPGMTKSSFGQILVAQGKVKEEDVARAAAIQRSGDPRRLSEILVGMGVLGPQDVVETINKQSETKPSVSDNSIRVDVNLLEKLMNLVGELVLARNQILQYAERQEDSTFLTASQRLNLITTELQEGVMKTRMQPIGTLWSKFPRVVRDLALSCGKQVRIEMDGKDTELDRTIIEALKDPLTHIVRNSIDHGIENPDVRRDRNKDPEGRLFLRAYHEGGQVNIEIVDDGSGIDTERVRQKVISKGLISAEMGARMSERELLNLIFLPGFSTKEQVTNISGRGVGMDVVKTNIEKIGGSLDLQSQLGHGTTLKIKIPLTLAIIPALIVSTCGERYAIPQVNLLELVRLEAEQARVGLEEVLGAPVYRLRGRLLPLLFLSRELKLSPLDDMERWRAREEVNIIVLQADDRQFGLVVEEINDTQEIVVKALGKYFKGINTFAGATIMGDGRVALILDVLGLAQRAKVVQESASRAAAEAARNAEKRQERMSLLLLEAGQHGRMAIPLSAVARLEEFATSSIEWAGRNPVVQYRGEIMQLIHLSKVMPERRKEPRASDAEATTTPATDKTQVVVYNRGGRSLGIVVGKIMDVVDEVLTEQRPGTRPGVLSTAIIQNKVTQLLDVEGIIQSFEQKQVRPRAAEGR